MVVALVRGLVLGRVFYLVLGRVLGLVIGHVLVIDLVMLFVPLGLFLVRILVL